MQRLIITTFEILVLCHLIGCATATRISIDAEEAFYEYEINHPMSKDDAFDRIEVWIAENYNNANEVTQLKRKETGTFILKPIVRYKAGGSLGADQYARYTFKMDIQDEKAYLGFELGPEISTGTYAPISEIPKIRANFETIRDGIAAAIEGHFP